jgi:dolichol kinase
MNEGENTGKKKAHHEVKNLLVRKGIHVLIACVPALAAFSYPLCVLLLCAGILLYAFVESVRICAPHERLWTPLSCISAITIFASHRRDKNRFVLGPLTLGAGALAALLVFPPAAAAAAIYALAAGDGLAGLLGRIGGRFRPRFLRGKSIEGSAACFAAVFAGTGLVTHDWPLAAAAALIGTLAEALPLEDFDNLLLPFAVGAFLTIAA